MNESQIVYLNGGYMPLHEARVPVLDRGFIFGDGVYEVVPVYGSKPFRWTGHRARLKRSLAAIGITDPHTDAQWEALIAELISRHAWPDQFVYLQVTRGVARRDHAFPADTEPTVFAMSSELVPVPADTLRDGVAAITLPDERWLHCDIKSISMLGNVLARQQAVQAGASECLMFRDGLLTEGSSSNVWIARDGTLRTPRRSHLLLEGIRVGLIGELCAETGIALESRNITVAEVRAADEILLTSATKEIVPVTRLDDNPVGQGKPGAIFTRLHAAYQRAKSRG